MTIPLRPYGSTAARRHLEGETPRPKTLTIDLHNHMRVPAAAEFVKPYLPPDEHTLSTFASAQSKEVQRKQGDDRHAHFTDIGQRLADMDRMAIDVMAVSCSPPQFYYGVDPKLGHEASQIVNDGIAAKIKPEPKRFVGLATVPLQDTDLEIR